MSAASSDSPPNEDDFAPLSALQHLAFCPRRCALIHLEQDWSENRCTAEGRLFHERAHEGRNEWCDGVLIVRGLRLASRRLGLAGVADVVEFHPADVGCVLPSREGRWQPYPVEYKVGQSKHHSADVIQLCGQALCLEEMLGASVPQGAIFYGKTRRRCAVEIGAALREETEALAVRLRRLLETGRTPPPEPGKKCELCSLREKCLPEMPRQALSFFKRNITAMLDDADEKT